MNQESEILYAGRYLDLAYRDGWEYAVRRHRAVVIVAWTPADELLLVEQFRVPVGSRTIELPAGLVGDQPGQEIESLVDAACRELEEETGWRAGSMHQGMSCPTSPGLTDERVVFMHAEQLEPIGDGGGDASEDIIVHRIVRADIGDWLDRRYREGLAIDPKIYAALYLSGCKMQPAANGHADAE